MNARLLLLLLLPIVALSGCIRSPVAMMASTKPLAPGGYTEIGPVELKGVSGTVHLHAAHHPA